MEIQNVRSTYINCGELKSLRPILKKWVRLNRRYCEMESWEECAWWANERASISTLAAAAWTIGGIALEEYSTAKVSKKQQRTGRCDLYIKIGKDKKFACEAKQIIPRLNKGNAHDTSNVKEQFDWACDDARNLSSGEGRRLGLCFVAPRFPHSQIPFDDCLEEYLENLQRLNFHAIAWYFPNKARHMKWKTNQRIYPGVVLLIREIFRGA